MIVFVQSIPRPNPLGVDAWVTANGQKIKKNKIGPRASTFVRALYDAKVGGLANYISYTPWIENAEPQLDAVGRPLMLQQKLERKWNLPEGYLHNRPIQLESYLNKPVDELSYFQAMRWKLSDGTTAFDLSKMDDELGYYVLLASTKVANSLQEYERKLWPKAEFYIVHTTEEEEMRYEKLYSKSKAFAAIHDSLMTDEIKRKLVDLLELASSKADLTTHQIHNLLVDHVESSANQNRLERFFNYINLLKTPDGRAKFEAMHQLKRALDTRVIYEKQDTYTWVRPNGSTLPIADRYSEAVEFFLNPKKDKEVKEILEQVEKRKK